MPVAKPGHGLASELGLGALVSCFLFTASLFRALGVVAGTLAGEKRRIPGVNEGKRSSALSRNSIMAERAGTASIVHRRGSRPSLAGRHRKCPERRIFRAISQGT